MVSKSVLFLLLCCAIIAGCTTPTATEKAAEPTATQVASEIEPTRTQPPTSTAIQPTSTATTVPTKAPSPSPSSTPTSTPQQGESRAIIIDHTSIELFEKIPDEYIEAASELSMLFRHASVGWNMQLGLDCLMGVQPRRPYCDRGVPQNERLQNSKYDWTNWTFEFHLPPPEQNPGWYNKVRLFIERMDSLDPGEKYDYAGFKWGYVDAIEGSEIEDQFFNYPNPTYPTYKELEELETRHPETKLIYWTIALARIVGTAESESFNQQLREYVIQNDKILLDLADIGSHAPDGTLCLDVEGGNYPALCEEYTDEPRSGHPNGYGSLIYAKALWVLMARLAGWDGVTQ